MRCAAASRLAGDPTTLPSNVTPPHATRPYPPQLYCDLLDDEALLHNVDSNEAEWKRKEEELDGDAATEASDGSGELGVVEGRNGEEALDGARVEHGQGEEKQTEEPYEHGRECLQEGEGEKKGEQSTDHDRELKQKDWQAEESAKVQEGGDSLSNGGPEEGGAQ